MRIGETGVGPRIADEVNPIGERDAGIGNVIGRHDDAGRLYKEGTGSVASGVEVEEQGSVGIGAGAGCKRIGCAVIDGTDILADGVAKAEDDLSIALERVADVVSQNV